VPFIKDVHSKEGLYNKKGEFFRCECPHLLVQKTLDFSKFMVCPHGQGGRGVEPVQTRERGHFFAILC